MAVSNCRNKPFCLARELEENRNEKRVSASDRDFRSLPKGGTQRVNRHKIVGKVGKFNKGSSFTITADQTPPLLQAITALPERCWRPLPESDLADVAEVCYQPTGWGRPYRYLVFDV